MEVPKYNRNDRANISIMITDNQARLYANHISCLPECSHIKEHDLINFFIKIEILCELLNPDNLVSYKINFTTINLN